MGQAGTMTHDYKRHDAMTLFAAFNVLDGTVIGHSMERHRRQEFTRFLIGGWTFHFIPTSASWFNVVGNFFVKLPRRRLQRGVFRSLVEPKDAIHRFIAESNPNP